jgi:hypothetical protein
MMPADDADTVRALVHLLAEARAEVAATRTRETRLRAAVAEYLQLETAPTFRAAAEQAAAVTSATSYIAPDTVRTLH